MYKREEHEELRSWESSIGALAHSTRTRGWDGLEAARKDGRIRANQEILIDAQVHLARTRRSQEQSARAHAWRARVEGCK